MGRVGGYNEAQCSTPGRHIIVMLGHVLVDDLCGNEWTQNQNVVKITTTNAHVPD
jgi:hypothetical protein